VCDICLVLTVVQFPAKEV